MAAARRILRALFGSPVNAVLTIAMLVLFYLAVPPFLRWALADATWDAASRKACIARIRGPPILDSGFSSRSRRSLRSRQETTAWRLAFSTCAGKSST